MKQDIHPKFNTKSKVKCSSCGTEFEVGSTEDEMSVDRCSNCHPFYTGKTKSVFDTTGRVERFKKMREAAEKAKEKAVSKSKKGKKKKSKNKDSKNKEEAKEEKDN